jgi:hypothetical protein
MHEATTREDTMTPEETALRAELSELAAQPRGRALLQLALRGLQDESRGLTAGCWNRRGVSGCLFQHAYWQGVSERVFRPGGLANEHIERFVGSADYRLVVRSIATFDRLGRRQYQEHVRGPLGLPRRRLREEEWRSAVEALLVDALASTPPASYDPTSAASCG